MRFRLFALTGALAALVLLDGACAPQDASPFAPPLPANATAAVAASPGSGASQAATALDALGVVVWAPMTGYSRDRFHHWDAQGGGCDTRDVVLRRDGEDVRMGSGCEISHGTWFSPYDGRTLTTPADLDVDHMVPLANAWRTGAAAWSDGQREAFANDLVRPQLLAVSLSANRSKGDQDPSQWRPPRHEYWCTYAERWIAVKSYWRLGVTAAEKGALADMLGSCA